MYCLVYYKEFWQSLIGVIIGSGRCNNFGTLYHSEQVMEAGHIHSLISPFIEDCCILPNTAGISVAIELCSSCLNIKERDNASVDSSAGLLLLGWWSVFVCGGR